ncbi:hypothetical protein ACFX13_028576 [Malus domestica]
MDEDMVLEALPEYIKSIGKAALQKQEWQAMPKKQEGQAVPSLSKNDDDPAKPTTTKRVRRLQKDRTHPYSDTSRCQEERMLGNAKVARLPQGFIKALPKGVEPSFLPTKKTE